MREGEETFKRIGRIFNNEFKRRKMMDQIEKKRASICSQELS